MGLFQMLAAVWLWRWSDKQDARLAAQDAEMLRLLSTTPLWAFRWNRFAEEFDPDLAERYR